MNGDLRGSESRIFPHGEEHSAAFVENLVLSGGTGIHPAGIFTITSQTPPKEGPANLAELLVLASYLMRNGEKWMSKVSLLGYIRGIIGGAFINERSPVRSPDGVRFSSCLDSGVYVVGW